MHPHDQRTPSDAPAPFYRRPILPNPPKNGVLVVPLGGCEQVGMNATLYGMQGRDGPEWILVDAGIGLGAENLNGLDAQVPDPIVLATLGPRLKACVVTHAHEDHIGALTLFWPQLKCPIVAPTYASAILDHRFQRAGKRQDVQLDTFSPGDTLTIGGFRINTVPVTHSVPDSAMLAFETPAGTILHTGDWKMDPTTVVGRGTNPETLQRLGDQGVRLMVSESTNANKEGRAGGEIEVAHALKKVCEETPGMVVVAGFASNMARVFAASWAAEKTGRFVGTVGGALTKAIQAGTDCGYIDDPDAFLDANMLNAKPRQQRLLLATGAQGEEGAGLQRLLRGRLPLSIGGGDALVMSARVIPGNEQAVEEIKRMARQMSVRVVTTDDAPIHVSGHGCQDDMRDMYQLIRPQALMTVHGGPEQLNAQRALAEACHIPLTPPPSDGSVFCVTKDSIVQLESVPVDRWGSDGTRAVRVEMAAALKAEQTSGRSHSQKPLRAAPQDPPRIRRRAPQYGRVR